MPPGRCLASGRGLTPSTISALASSLRCNFTLPLATLCCAPRFAETPFKAEMIRRRVMMTTETAASGGVGLGRGGRMSRKRKRDAVLRLLRGEDLETLSRALGATAATLSGWQD